MSFEGTDQNYPINHNFNEDIKNFIRVTLSCDDFKHFSRLTEKSACLSK